MILPFSTEISGEKNYFIEKIWKCLIQDLHFQSNDKSKFMVDYQVRFGCTWDQQNLVTVPKRHTIRDDKHNRWKPGRLIHQVVFNRSKNQFQFTPVIVCKSVQTIEIFVTADGAEVVVDGRVLSEFECKALALNDGFNDVEDFLNYFSTDCERKIIHWTDLKY